MKKVFLCVIVMFVSGFSCSKKLLSPQNSSAIDSKTNTPVAVSSSQPILLDAPVLFSYGAPPVPLLAFARSKKSKRPLAVSFSEPFEIKSGEIFTVKEGCDTAPSYIDTYVLKKIQGKDDQWELLLEQEGPFDVTLHTPSGEQPAEWEEDFLVMKPVKIPFSISSFDPIDFVEGTGGIYAANGVFIPVFISKERVFFRYTKISC